MRKITHWPCLTVVVAVLASCGGGGGGGGGGPAAPTAVIDAGNAQAIAGSVVAGNLGTTSSLSWSGGQVGSQQAPAGAGTLAVGRLVARFAAGHAGRRGISSASGALVRVSPQVAVGPDTEGCLVGGTTTVSGNLANPPDFGAGDQINITFNDCDDGDGVVADGSLVLNITSLSGDVFSGAFRLVADTTFTNLRLTAGSDSETVTGTGALTFDSTDPDREIIRLVAGSLRLVAGEHIFRFTDYDLQEDVDLASDQYTLRIAGQMADASAFQGTVDIATLTPFTGYGEGYPSAGRLRITGATVGPNAGTIDVEALDPMDVHLSIDPEGDGVGNDERDLTWFDLVNNFSPVPLNNGNAVAVAQDMQVVVSALGVLTSAVAGELTVFAVRDLVQSGASGTVPAETHACGSAGTVTVSAVMAGGSTYQPGDQFDVVFADCRESGTAPAMNGQAHFVITAYSGQLFANQSYSLSATAAVTNLTSTPALIGVTAEGNGTFDLTYALEYSPQGLPVHGTQSYSSAGLSASTSDGTYFWQDLMLESAADFSTVQPVTVTKLTGRASGTVSSPVLGGTVQIATPEAQQQASDNDPATGPYAGLRTITGQFDSRIRELPLDDMNVRLDIDVDGDLTWDRTQTTTWAVLNANLTP